MKETDERSDGGTGRYGGGGGLGWDRDGCEREQTSLYAVVK